MSTMGAVAAAAGVSISTVSHVINKTRKVSPETERAVLQAIEQLGYTPNSLARALTGARTGTVGVAISALTNQYFAGVVQAIEAECARDGLMMLLADTHDEPAYEMRVVRALHQRRVDGILIAPTEDSMSSSLGYLRDRGVPTVLVDRILGTSFDQVAVEGRESTRELVAHLIRLGHRRIGYVAGAANLSTTAERVDGYRLALAGAGIGFDPELLVSGESKSEPACAAVKRLLALRCPPTALVTGNNLMTIGAMRALRTSGVEVPRDMSLVGFDDFEWAEEFSPRLTVIAQPVEELGRRAVRLLARRMAQPDARRQTIRLTPVLRIRDSARSL